MSEARNPCVNCRWHEAHDGGLPIVHTCHNPKINGVSAVDGKANFNFCGTLRYEPRPGFFARLAGFPDRCGHGGAYFEASTLPEITA